MHRRANKTRRNRKFRWLLEAVIPADDARVPVHLRGGLIRTRLDTTDDDRARKINRAENLRPIHRDDHRSSVVIDQRNRAEILFSRVKHRWANGRIPAVGVPYQTLRLLGIAMAINRQADLAYRKRTGHPPGIAQAA